MPRVFPLSVVPVMRPKRGPEDGSWKTEEKAYLCSAGGKRTQVLRSTGGETSAELHGRGIRRRSTSPRSLRSGGQNERKLKWFLRSPPSRPLRSCSSAATEPFIIGARKQSRGELRQLPGSRAVSIATSLRGRGLACTANQGGRRPNDGSESGETKEFRNKRLKTTTCEAVCLFFWSTSILGYYKYAYLKYSLILMPVWCVGISGM